MNNEDEGANSMRAKDLKEALESIDDEALIVLNGDIDTPATYVAEIVGETPVFVIGFVDPGKGEGSGDD